MIEITRVTGGCCRGSPGACRGSALKHVFDKLCLTGASICARPGKNARSQVIVAAARLVCVLLPVITGFLPACTRIVADEDQRNTSKNLAHQSSPPAEAAPRTAVQAAYGTALQDFSKYHDISRIRSKLESCVKQDPSFNIVRFQLAVLAEHEHDWPTAVRWFEEFLSRDHSSALAGKIKVELESIRPLALNATQTIRKLDGHADLVNRAKLDLERGDAAAAVSVAEQAIQTEPTFLDGYLIGCSALVALHEFRLEEQLISQATVFATGDTLEKLFVIGRDYRSARDVALQLNGSQRGQNVVTDTALAKLKRLAVLQDSSATRTAKRSQTQSPKATMASQFLQKVHSKN